MAKELLSEFLFTTEINHTYYVEATAHPEGKSSAQGVVPPT